MSRDNIHVMRRLAWIYTPVFVVSLTVLAVSAGMTATINGLGALALLAGIATIAAFTIDAGAEL